MHINTLYIFVLTTTLVAAFEDPSLEDKKIKLASCIKLISVALKEDKDLLFESVKAFVPEFKSALYDSTYVATRDGLILSCFGEISMIKAADLSSTQKERINPFTKENKKLLNHENFETRYKNDETRRSKDLKTIAFLENELQTEISHLEEVIATGIEPFILEKNKVNSIHREKSKDPNKNKKKVEREDDDARESYANSLSLFGVNLNDSKIKNTLGFGLLIIVIISLFLLFKHVTRKEEPKKKKEKKKNE